ncbi:hypothetical protein TIFTF001_030611 [Ficus carica]|uniref:DDE Tnp4 domain-containing protein n=1 Tax=Ficus carica TaxID=3494 RepID=A0AA88DTJ8_FICCA|nr:hypothetical protein TIFTF001_030611 [Ficus carica]
MRRRLRSAKQNRTKGLLTHYSRVRKALFGVLSGEVFNYTHSSLRNCIERTFGVWKARLKILKGTNSYPMDKQAMIPVACAILHNFIRMVQVGDPLHEDYAGDCMPVSENVDVNADDEVDDVAFGTGPSTGPQHLDTRRDAMNMLRDMMADDMWDRFQSAPWYRTTQALAS